MNYRLFWGIYVVPRGFEPWTPSLSEKCSNQLSYETINKKIPKRQIMNNISDSQYKNSKKEIFQPHLPVRLPCYDLAPVTGITLGRSLRLRTSGTPDFHGLTGGVYKARERIHRTMADVRLLANPTSRSRVADSDPN